MPEPPKSPSSRKARRRREQRAKKKALQSSSNDPANPAIYAAAAAAQKPQIPKPHIVKPTIAKPSTTFGLRLSDLILRDSIQLYSSAPAPVRKRNGHDDDEEEEGVEEDEEPVPAQKRMAIHAQLVLAQAHLQRRQLHTPASRSSLSVSKISTQKPPSPKHASKYNKSTTFPFSKLPPELRIMISTRIFTASSGQKPRFLWAVQGNKELYGETKEVWCKVNEFGFTYLKSGLNGIREGMSSSTKALVRRAVVNVHKDINPLTPPSPALLLFPALTHLTLHVSTPSAFSLSIHHIIPSLHSLQQIKVFIHGPKRIIQAHVPHDLGEFFRPFLQTRTMLDRMLSKNGKCVHVGSRLQEWVWEAEKGECFRPRSGKVHIKFDEQANVISLQPVQDGSDAS